MGKSVEIPSRDGTCGSIAQVGPPDLAERRQTCKVCGRPDKFDFGVSDAEWARIVPKNYRRLVVCLACFDTFAHARGLNYALTHLLFVGDQGAFSFLPA